MADFPFEQLDVTPSLQIHSRLPIASPRLAVITPNHHHPAHPRCPRVGPVPSDLLEPPHELANDVFDQGGRSRRHNPRLEPEP